MVRRPRRGEAVLQARGRREPTGPRHRAPAGGDPHQRRRHLRRAGVPPGVRRIQFTGTSWLGPSSAEGYVSQQNGGYMKGVYEYRPADALTSCSRGCEPFERARNTWYQMPSAVQVSAADHITFARNTFSNLGPRPRHRQRRQRGADRDRARRQRHRRDRQRVHPGRWPRPVRRRGTGGRAPPQRPPDDEPGHPHRQQHHQPRRHGVPGQLRYPEHLRDQGADRPQRGRATSPTQSTPVTAGGSTTPGGSRSTSTAGTTSTTRSTRRRRR